MCRVWDRVEGLLIVGVVVAALVAVPLAVSVGRTAYDTGIQNAAVQMASGHWGQARLLQTAPNSAVSDTPNVMTSLARARWETPAGTWRVGDVPVRAGTPQGSSVRVWMNASGQVTRPPLRPAQVSDRAVATGVTTLMAMELGVTLVYLLLRWLIDRRRLAAWEEEWARVAPRWTRKYH